MKESKAMMKKEVSFMKKKGAPKSMLKHEMAEMRGMKKMNVGGQTDRAGTTAGDAFGRIGTSQKKMAGGGMAKSGGSFRRVADGIASKGKTKGKMVKMRMGGSCG